MFSLHINVVCGRHNISEVPVLIFDHLVVNPDDAKLLQIMVVHQDVEPQEPALSTSRHSYQYECSTFRIQLALFCVMNTSFIVLSLHT